MRDTRKSVASLAGAGTLAVLLATSAFAQDNQGAGRSREAWHGRQPATAPSNAPRNQAQVAPPQQQAQANLRNGGSRDAAAQQNRQSQANRGFDATRNVPATANGNWNNSARETAQASAANRGYQASRSNQPANSNRAFNSNNSSNWNSGARESARVTESNRGARDNGRVNLSGRVTSFTHEGNGYRVRLDRDGRSFWIPESRLGNRGLRVGLSIGLGGIFSGGIVNVDAINWGGAYGYAPAYAQGYVSGVVEQVDYRTNTILLRDQSSGSIFNVDMRAAGATSRIDARNLRPGDFLTLSGQWDSAGLFEAYRVDNLNNRIF
jgi:hypothetical protein